MNAKKKTPFAMPGVGGLMKKARWNLVHLWSWLGKRYRLCRARIRRDRCAQAVDRAFDRQASLQLDAAQLLLESEEAGGVEL